MKVTIFKQDLLKGLSVAMKATDSSGSTPILQCVKMESKNETIKLTGNNRVLGAEVEVYGEILEDGAFAADAKAFNDVVKKMPNEGITISYQADNNLLSLTCKEIKIHITQVIRPEEFIDLPEVGTAEPITIKQDVFKNMIAGTAFALSKNDANKAMECFNICVKNEQLRITALDSHRVATRTIHCVSKDVEALVLGNYLSSIVSVFDNKNKEMGLYICKNHIVIEYELTRLIIARVDRKYFNLSHLFNEGDIKVKINRKDFMDSLDRAALIVREAKKPIILSITQDGMRLYQKTIKGKIEENLPAIKIGEDIKIGFNPVTLLDVLKVVNQEEVELIFSKSTTPVLIQGEGYKYIVLPVNLPKGE